MTASIVFGQDMVGVSVCALAPIFYQRGEYFLVKRVPSVSILVPSSNLPQGCGFIFVEGSWEYYIKTELRWPRVYGRRKKFYRTVFSKKMVFDIIAYKNIYNKYEGREIWKL